jgi:hypothetical protein
MCKSPASRRQAARRFSGLTICLTAIALFSVGCFVFPQAPVIESVQPDSGSTAGGTQITIIGAFFEAPVAVTLNDVAATNVQYIHAQAITASRCDSRTDASLR